MESEESVYPPVQRKVSLVVPFYNEEDSVDYFYGQLSALLNSILDVDWEVVCVNDGSADSTYDKLCALSEIDHRFIIVDLARNFGKEAALTAGIDFATGDAVIPIDADLQDPPELIPQLIATWIKGFDVVLARRADRHADGFMKRNSAHWFYKVHNMISDVPIPEDVGDFRLMDRKVVEALARMPERRRFMKGLFSWVGFRTATVDYVRVERMAGKTKFSGWRLWNLALEGITGFSTAPLRLWTYLGLITATVAFAYAVWIIARTILFGVDLRGYASMLTIVLFLGGINLIGIGVIGEYIGRIYMETKQRPIYIVRSVKR